MNLKQYSLNELEKARLIQGVQAALAIPLIDSLEDFIWESLFCYTKQIPIVDPLFDTRKKWLFDIVDAKTQVGWSAKALQLRIKEEVEFEVVIQRADIFKKNEVLGFPNLTINSDEQLIGAALLKHWHLKIEEDAIKQNVQQKRVSILLKNPKNTEFAFFEEDLAIYEPQDLFWKWTDTTRTGLQGIRKSDNFCVYRWYPNQKQFFERFRLHKDSFIFQLTPKRVDLEEIIAFLNERIANTH